MNEKMCGIIGFIGNREAAPILLEGLRKLEYRGYDSVGMTTLHNGKFFCIKDKGRVEDVHKKYNFLKLPGRIGIAHTRWATHGKVCKENAHPHFDCKNKIAIVHNGVIENFEELKKELIEKGHKFKSETDTEVICHLIEEEMKNNKNFFESCKNALRKLEGSYALLILNKEKSLIIAAKKGSPLVLGISDFGYFAASDIPAFLNYTKKVVFLYDYDLIAIGNSLQFYNLKENKFVERKIEEIDLSEEKIEKGKFEHFMIKEILEQVETIKKASVQNERLLKKVAMEIKKAKKVFLIGCGTSFHACVAASYLFSKIAGLHLTPILASEFPNFKNLFDKNTVVIAVSQSGETYDVLDAVKFAKEKGSKIISLVNVLGSSLTRISDVVIPINAGLEICVLATKTYTSQLVIFFLLACACKKNLENAKFKLKFLWNILYNLTSLTMRKQIKKLAKILKNKEHIFLIGRGLEYVTALEAALKIKEASYIHAEAFAGGELKHGTISLIEKNTPCIAFVSNENEREIVSNAIEIKSRGGFIIGISPKFNEIFDFWIKVPECEELNPIIQIIPMQILAYQLALLRGYDPDHPRNLAKSVTVK